MARTDTPAPIRPLIRWVLGLSLALNLLIIGAIAGAFLRHGGPPDRGGRFDAAGYGAPYVQALSRADKRQMRKALKDLRGSLPSRKDRRALYGEMLTVLRADDFDRDRVLALFETQRGIALSVQSAAQDAWLAHISAMSLQERRAFADRLEEVLRRGPRKRDRDR